MVEPQPSIELFGLIFHTPVTAITDVIVAAICWVAYQRLGKLPVKGEVYTLFKFYFLSMSIATFLGGMVGHALMHYLPFFMKLPGWIASMLSVALLERAMIQYTRKYLRPKIGQIFSVLNIIELLVFISLALVTLNFQFVLIHAAYGIAIVVGGFGFFAYQKGSSGSLQILQGVLVCAVGACFFVFEIGLSKWFNHVDISHVCMMIASVLFYKASRKLIVSS